MMRISCDLRSTQLDALYVQRLLEWVRGSSLSRAVLLAHEQVYGDDGKRLDTGSFYVPNSYVLELCKAHPEFLAGVSIHPARPDALEELDFCLEHGAALMKCLPNCQNIDCSNIRFTKFWEKMAEAKLPLLAHTGGEMSVPVVQKAYADPRTLKRPLEIGVTVIAAHSGSSSHPFDRDYSRVFAEMLRKFPNLYGDNSALNSPFRSAHFRKLLEPDIAQRIVHGSDLPIPISARWAGLRGLITTADYRRAEREENLLERDILIKRAMGFPESCFSQVEKLLRLKASVA